MSKIVQLKKLQILRQKKLQLSKSRVAEIQNELNSVQNAIEDTIDERTALHVSGRETLEDAIQYAEKGFASPSKIVNISVILNKHTRKLTDISARLRKLSAREEQAEKEMVDRKSGHLAALRDLQKLDGIVERDRKIESVRAELVEEEEVSDVGLGRGAGIIC